MSTLALRTNLGSSTFYWGTTAAGEDARDLRNQFAQIINFPNRERLDAELISFGDMNAVASWHGPDAVPARREAIEEARTFLFELPTRFLDSLEVSPDEDGACSLDWYRSATRQLSISLDGQGQIHYAAILGSVERVSGRLPFYGSIPEEINRLLGRLK